MSSATPGPIAHLPVEVWGNTDPGQAREINEDSFYFPAKQTRGYKKIEQNLLDSKGYLLIVADGIGGSDYGQLASREVVDALRPIYYESAIGDPQQNLGNAVQFANESLYQKRMRNPALGQAGSTVVVAAIYNNILYVANVGDSRAYLIRNGQAFPRTKDHSLVQEKLDRGLPVSEADHSVITRSMGAAPTVQADLYTPTPLENGDVVVLCSDGLSDLVKSEEMVQVVSSRSPRQAVKKLIRMANSRGGHDNITVIVASVGQTKARPAIMITRRQMLILAAVVIGVLLIWILALVLFGTGSDRNPPTAGGTVTGTPTLLPLTPTTGTTVFTATVTLAPTLTTVPTPTPRSSGPGENSTAVPSPSVVPPAAQPTDTPHPSCKDGEFWDPFLNLCRRNPGGSNNSIPTPIPR